MRCAIQASVRHAVMKDSPAVAAREARLLARAVVSGALATLRRSARAADEGGGQPYVSKVGVALDATGQPIFLFSTLAAHTQDLLADPRCSLLVEAPATGRNPLQAARATLVGKAVRLNGADAELARSLYLARHPGAAQYAGFGDFAFWRLHVEKIHYVGGFGVAKWAKGVDYLLPDTGLDARARLISQLNGPKRADLLLAAQCSKNWQVIDVDGDGALLVGPKQKLARLNFPLAAKDLRAWRVRFAALAKRVKAAPKSH